MALNMLLFLLPWRQYCIGLYIKHSDSDALNTLFIVVLDLLNNILLYV
jgi:hypothetical protein